MKQKAKIYISILLGILIIMLCCSSFADGFSTNPEQINEAAKSVMMLEIYSGNEIIATGSGFVAFDNRHLITNYHVIEGSDMIWAYSDVGDPYIIMDVCILDEEKDIAILQFFSPTDLKPLALSETGEVLRAAPVVAIGSPKGFKNTVSIGNVSFADREDNISYIQFTAPISSGSSGGALFDENGDVVGITTFAIQGEAGISQNMNFAINIREAVLLYDTWSNESEKQVFSLQDMGKASTDVSADVQQADTTIQDNPASTPEPVDTYDYEIKEVKYHRRSDGTLEFLFSIKNNTSEKIKEFTVSLTTIRFSNGDFTTISTTHTYKYAIEPGGTIKTLWHAYPEIDGLIASASLQSVVLADDTLYVIPEEQHQLFDVF